MNPLYTLVARALLSVLFIGGFGAITMYVLTQDADFPPGVKEVILYLMGALTTGVITVVNFWFSSTQGSADKTAALYGRNDESGSTHH
ncbi:MAG: hypothetical protein VKI63_02600 [Cyanobium sp.]|nr:hypothetical protein [Cyanobium sp.]